MYSLQDLSDAVHYWKKGDDVLIRRIVQPMENAVEHVPKVWVVDTAINTICHGRDLALPGIAKHHSDISKCDLVAIMSLNNQLIALGRANNMIGDKGIAVVTEKVFMLPQN
jgi:H/ACA ribonucleoprotein complex subunit 4